jgi:hypothetical protein
MIKKTCGTQKIAKMPDIQFAQAVEKHISFHNCSKQAWIHGATYTPTAPKVKLPSG